MGGPISDSRGEGGSKRKGRVSPHTYNQISPILVRFESNGSVQLRPATCISSAYKII